MASKTAKKRTVPTDAQTAEQLRDELSVNDHGVIEADNTYYEKHLPEGLSMELVRKLQEHDHWFRKVSTMAAGPTAVDHFTEHPETLEMSFSYQRGHSQETIHFDRTGDSAVIRHVVDDHAHNDNGELKSVVDQLRTLLDGVNT